MAPVHVAWVSPWDFTWWLNTFCGVPIVISLGSITCCKGCSFNWIGFYFVRRILPDFLQWASFRIHFSGFHIVLDGVFLRISLIESPQVSYNTLKHCLKTISKPRSAFLEHQLTHFFVFLAATARYSNIYIYICIYIYIYIYKYKSEWVMGNRLPRR